MSPKRREKLLRVLDGSQNEFVLQTLFWIHTNTRRADDVLDWLVCRGMTGLKLADSLKNEFNMSPFLLIAYALKDIEGTRGERGLFVGKDIIE